MNIGNRGWQESSETSQTENLATHLPFVLLTLVKDPQMHQNQILRYAQEDKRNGVWQSYWLDWLNHITECCNSNTCNPTITIP